MMPTGYSLYGLIVLAAISVGQWMGVPGASINEVKDVPKSVRENPGVYRSHYSFLPRWFGGK
ncbi:MAG: hypothetical protein HY821_14405 [Acidobacteria bacterium]|nr:hypothetical protein [Acidobacteriota bacterium]